MKNRKQTTGIGLCDVMLVVFVVLKLCKLITWSWVWVLSPLWIGVFIIAVAEIINKKT